MVSEEEGLFFVTCDSTASFIFSKGPILISKTKPSNENQCQ